MRAVATALASAALLLALSAEAAPGQAPPEPVQSAQRTAASSSLQVRAPAGLDSRAPPGANLTDGLGDALATSAPARDPAPGSGEWVAVPMPFRNALLGAGLQFAVGRLYRQSDEPAQADASMFGTGGMYAEGGSWAAAVGDRRYWGERASLRSTLAIGAGEVGYPVEAAPGLSLPVTQGFRGGSLSLSWEALDRLWLTAGYRYASTEIRIERLEIANEELSIEPAYTVELAQLRLGAEWDSRSDEFYPRDGMLASSTADVANAIFGSDRDYVAYELAFNGYRSIGERHVLAWRAAGRTAWGDPPFFALPWYGSGVDLRGYAPGTYIGRTLAAAQAEWRWQATRRLGLAAFGGVGGVWGDPGAFEQDDFLPAGGVGLRWRLTDEFRVNFRLDYAWGKDDDVLLIAVGEAF